jgi:peptidoglycan/LPS O-acetylase OafA/YrhL
LLLIIFIFISRNETAILFAITTVFALVLLTMFPDDQFISSAWPVKPFMYLGKISYSLYLIHLPICWLLAPKFYSWGFNSITHTMVITIPVCMGISITLSIFFYLYFEKPFTAKKLSRYSQRGGFKK